jgi:acetyltransferase-like isoleucine patch superfamily enzyme
MKPKRHQAGVVNVQFGKDCVIVEPLNIYGCELGDGCFVGPFVEIQCGVTVGKRTRIQSHTFICELVTIGSDCFIGHGVMFINDLLRNGEPERGDKSTWLSTNISDNVSIGSNATILPVNICENVVIGAGAVVTKDITKTGVYAGNPAKYLRPIDTESSSA